MTTPTTMTIYLVETGLGRTYFSTVPLAVAYAEEKVGLDGRAAVPKAVLTRAGSEALWDLDGAVTRGAPQERRPKAPTPSGRGRSAPAA